MPLKQGRRLSAEHHMQRVLRVGVYVNSYQCCTSQLLCANNNGNAPKAKLRQRLALIPPWTLDAAAFF